VYKEEVRSLDMVKVRLSDRLRELEVELKELRERHSELEERLRVTEEEAIDPESDVPMAQRKRFTRTEMARVLMDRNQFKV
jgi:predicted nuclease with TOPRIM domain